MDRMPGSDSEPASRLLRERVRTLFRHLPGALGGSEERLHQMRVASRRLRLALRLLALKPDGRRVRRSIEALRLIVGTGGGSRDLDVGLALLEERMAGLAPVRPELRRLRGRLRSARTRQHHGMAEALLDQDLARLRRDLRRVAARGGDGLFVVTSRLRKERDDIASEMLNLLQVTADRFDPAVLHRIRTRARRLRYLAEIADAVRGGSSGAAGLFRELQEALGQVHDAHVLSAWLGEQAEMAQARGAVALARAARAQQTCFLGRSRALHRELLERGPIETVRRGLAALGSRSAA
jgi:CHAD domain-containing protein